MEKEIAEMSFAELKQGIKEFGGKTPITKAAAQTQYKELLEKHTIAHVVTEQTLVDNPVLVEKGVKVGDTIRLPIEANDGAGSAEEKNEDGAAAANTEKPKEPAKKAVKAKPAKRELAEGEYEMKRSVKHNGVTYEKGGVALLEPELAKLFSEMGVI